jgi:HlyD family type I secretion membrane fusion protein
VRDFVCSDRVIEGETPMSLVGDYSEWAKDVPTSTRKIGFAAYGTIARFLAAFGVWGVTAPLDGAAAALDVIAAAGKNLTIQHLESGNIEEVLDPTVPQSQLNRLTKAKSSLEARATRLRAERDGAAELSFPVDLNSSTVPDIVEILDGQTNDFNSGPRRHESEINILRQRVSALEDSISGLDAQKKAAEDQLAIVSDEIVRKKKLLDKGLTDRSQSTGLIRNQAELLGQIGAASSQIASAKTQIGEARKQIERATTQRVEQASKDRTDVRHQATDYEEQIIASRSVLRRAVVTAPIDGMTARLNINSKGSVVQPGEILPEILPTTNDLIVQAKMDPKQVDSIRVGQSSRLRFIALNSRSAPEVAAAVTFISPNRLVDEAIQQPYYVIRLRIDALPKEVSPDQVYQGMPEEAFISTGDRAFAEYLARPMMDSFSRAFRED